jgi:uncharacterized membrane protein
MMQRNKFCYSLLMSFLLLVNQARAVEGPVTAYYNCGILPVKASFAKDSLELEIKGKKHQFIPVIAASGARYESLPGSEIWMEFWEAKGKATLKIENDKTSYNCHKISLAQQYGSSLSNYMAIGHHPEWRLEIDTKKMFLFLEGKKTKESYLPKLSTTKGGYVYLFDGGELQMTKTGSVCQDTYTKLYYPNHVTINIGGKLYQGCGGPKFQIK